MNTRVREVQPVQEGLALFGSLGSQLVHDMSLPLTAASLNLALCSENQRQYVQRARQNIRQLERYIAAAKRQLLQSSGRSEFSVRYELQQALLLLRPLAARQNVDLRLHLDGAYHLHGDPVIFSRIITNLVRNALESYAQSARPRQVVLIAVTQTPGKLVVTVSDFGCGMTAPVLARVFEPFFTTKRNQRLTNCGLGLVAVKDMVTGHFHGVIAIESNPGVGTIVTVQIPL